METGPTVSRTKAVGWRLLGEVANAVRREGVTSG